MLQTSMALCTVHNRKGVLGSAPILAAHDVIGESVETYPE